MELEYIKSLKLGGFNFDNAIRNKALVDSGKVPATKNIKTGTTICGAIFDVRNPEIPSLV